jgi:hypothetical protein
MDKKKIVDEIDYDINRGVYDTFPKLKNRLTSIRRKLYSGIYIINAEELTAGEIQTLIENDYLEEDFKPNKFGRGW